MAEERLYYIQDTRSAVGNCASFWRPNGNGYTCNLDEAGLYTETEVNARTWRETDRPVLKEEVDKIAIRHARVDNASDLLALFQKKRKR